MLGCNGLLSGSGSVIPDLQAQLFHAVKANDLAEARRLNDRIYPLARVFYADPWADMHNRMKEALVLLGRLPRAVVRPPLVKLVRRRDRPHPRGAGGGRPASPPRRAATRRTVPFASLIRSSRFRQRLRRAHGSDAMSRGEQPQPAIAGSRGRTC